MEKIILVTGGNGLVGHGIQSVLENCENEKWVFVSSKDADLLDETDVRKLFIKVRPTHVVHLAANVGGLFKNMQDNLNMFRKNMKMNENVLSACYDFKIKKCISCLSTCIFPDNVKYPITESMLHNGPPHFSNFGYAYAKRNIDVLNRCYNQSSSETLFTSVIPCNVFGPYDNYNLQNGHVIPVLIHKAFIAQGSGKPLRQFIYSKDLGRLIIKVVREYESPDPIILSVDEYDEVSIKEAAEEIVKNFEKKSDKIIIKFDTNFADGQYKKTVSNNKMKNLWPDFKFTSFNKAIEESINWFIDNQLLIKK